MKLTINNVCSSIDLPAFYLIIKYAQVELESEDRAVLAEFQGFKGQPLIVTFCFILVLHFFLSSPLKGLLICWAHHQKVTYDTPPILSYPIALIWNSF